MNIMHLNVVFVNFSLILNLRVNVLAIVKLSLTMNLQFLELKSIQSNSKSNLNSTLSANSLGFNVIFRMRNNSLLKLDQKGRFTLRTKSWLMLSHFKVELHLKLSLVHPLVANFKLFLILVLREDMTQMWFHLHIMLRQLLF
jgi:hypothetical protein